MASFRGSVVRPYMVGMTLVARKALRGRKLPLAAMPFRVGRETRVLQEPAWTRKKGKDRRKGKSNPNNNLYIQESEQTDFLSREHFLIDDLEENQFVLVDRGSQRGTLVNGILIGGNGKKQTIQISDRAILIPGGKKSGFKFRFEHRGPHKRVVRSRA